MKLELCKVDGITIGIHMSMEQRKLIKSFFANNSAFIYDKVAYRYNYCVKHKHIHYLIPNNLSFLTHIKDEMKLEFDVKLQELNFIQKVPLWIRGFFKWFDNLFN